MKKISILIASLVILIASVPCFAMMRSARLPMRKAVPSRVHAHVAQIKARYALPNARPATELVARMTSEQLLTHLKHQELCFKVAKNIKVSAEAKKQLKEMAKQLAKTSVKPLIAGYVSMNNTDVGPELFQLACLETQLSLDCVRLAWQDYKKSQENIETAEQALAALVAEQKFQVKVPYDIQ